MVRQPIMMWASFLLVAAGPASGAPTAVPRYQFAAGQELTYHEDFSMSYTLRERWSVWDTKLDIVVRVVRKNEDGSFRLVFAMKDHSTKTTPEKTTTDTSNSVFYADVFPDGRELPMDWSRFAWTPASLFPPLPRDENEAKKGWEGRAQENEFHCLPSGDGQAFTFQSQTSSPALRTVGDTHSVKLTFDPSRGFITRIEDNVNRDSNIKGNGSGTILLTGVKAMPAAELERYARESDRYFAAINAYDATMNRAEASSRDDAVATAREADAALKQVVATLASPDLKADGQEVLSGHKARLDHILGVIANRANRIGKPAPDFETSDVLGTKVRLSDYRGKVVVLDFWYRGCAWCAKTTPQLNQLAEDFAGKPVAVLGMSIDRDVADSLSVIKTLKIKYPTLRAEGLSERFGVEGYPTIILIDREGIVRKVEAGYSLTIREEWGKEIRKLLE